MDGELHYETHRVHSTIVVKRNFNATFKGECKFTELLHKNTKVHKIQVKIIGKTLIELWPFLTFAIW